MEKTEQEIQAYSDPILTCSLNKIDALKILSLYFLKQDQTSYSQGDYCKDAGKIMFDAIYRNIKNI